MKVEIKNPLTNHEINFPCLMYSIIETTNNPQIILATGYANDGNLIGTKLSFNEGEDWPCGDHSSIWTVADFKPFEGSITLSND